VVTYVEGHPRLQAMFWLHYYALPEDN
jgi:hypothetical protein